MHLGGCASALLSLPVSLCQSDAHVQMQYFPEEARLDKMFFPYYGKKAHVSKSAGADGGTDANR